MSTQVDQPLAEIALRQHGVVSQAQLLALGIGPSAVTRRVAAGRLHRLHRGVFAVGHASLTVKSRWMAAVLALRPGAVLSHRSAAALHGLRPSSGSSVDVLIPRSSGPSRRDGLTVHRTTNLPASERTEIDGIPCTTWARTLLDLATQVNDQALARALERSEELRLFDFPTLAALLSDHPGHQGIGKLKRLLTIYEPRQTSELQRLFLELCETYGLPKPEEEQDIDGHRVDFLWRRQRVVVETDGWRFHRTRQAWARDREQEARLAVAGYTVLRPTWDDVTANAATTAQRVRTLLSR